MIVEWLDLLAVTVATIVGAMSFIILFSLGVRLRAIAHDYEKGDSQYRMYTGFAWVFFALVGVAVVFGIWLIVPVFH